MERETLPQRSELSPQSVVTPSAIESLLHPEFPDNPWPEEIRNNPELQKQAEIRRVLSGKLDTLCKQVPQSDLSIEAALDAKLITEREIAELYSSISNLLDEDPASNRILLYLPFELLPDSKRRYETPELAQASEQFSSLFLREWRKLLTEHNLRADFVDGDVSEFEHRTGPLPQVVKAAHLIPKLIERNLISSEEIITLMEETPDAVLAESIADTLPVLADMELLPEKIIERMARSENRLVENMGTLIRAQNKQTEENLEIAEKPIDLAHILSSLLQEEERIRSQYEKNTHNRNKWLEQEDVRRSVKKHAHQISIALSQNMIRPEELLAATSHKNSHETTAIIRAIQETIETKARENKIEAIAEYSHHKSLLADLSQNTDNAEVRDTLESVICRLSVLGIVENATLEEFGIPPPALNPSFPEKMGGMKADIADVHTMTANIESNAELSKLIYPVALLMGSRMNGYSKKASDLDLGVFVRPDVSFEERARLQGLVRETLFIHEKIQSQPMEFWLEENGSELSVQDFKNPDTALGDSTLAHPLLGAWCGNESAIRELHERLLAGYLYSEGKKILGEDARRVWLEEMEHNILQYRLMHKGYERFFPEQGGIHTPHSDAIDGESAFYDSGYRRLATQLFVNKVFLPQLERPADKK